MFIADVKLGRKYRLMDIPKTGIAAYVECAYSMSIYQTFLLYFSVYYFYSHF